MGCIHYIFIQVKRGFKGLLFTSSSIHYTLFKTQIIGEGIVLIDTLLN